MSGSFTWNAIVRIGALKPYEKALVITVYHECDQWHDGPRAPAHAHWNTIVCFNAALRDRLQTALTAGDLVHFQGYVRTTTFTDEAEATRRAVDLVITRFDLLQKHIEGPAETGPTRQ